MLSLFFKLLFFNLFIYFLFPFSSGIVAQCYYLFLQCLPTVWEGIADSETIVHSASRLGTGSNRRRQAFVFRKGIKKKMLLCIIAADLREALRDGEILLFAKVINIEALWCFT